MLPGFDKSYYLASKLSALQAWYTEWQTRDVDFLESLLMQSGMTAETHYSTYGYKEGLNPDAYFNRDEYRFAKAIQLVTQGHFQTMEAALNGFDAAWPWDLYLHYLQYGAKEGINPSNQFDESQYLSDKLNALKADPATNSQWTGKETADLRNFLSGIGMTALDHFIQYGAAEGLSAPSVPTAEQVDPSDTPWEMPHADITIPSNLDLEWVNTAAIKANPYSAIGLVTVTANGESNIGTGFLISPEHIMTSAHVLLDENGNYNPSAELKFFPALNNDVSSAVSFGANQVRLEKTFTSDLYSTWPDDDLAVIRLNTPVGNSRGYLKPMLYNPADTDSITFESSGYPAGNIEEDNPATPGRDFYQWKVTGSVTDSIFSQGAFKMTGSMLSSPGASGSPVFNFQNNEYGFIGVYSGTLSDAPVSAAMDNNSYNWLMSILQQDGYYLDYTLVQQPINI